MEILRWLGLPQNPWSEFVLLATSGVVLYLLLAGASYLLVFRVFRERLHPDFEPVPGAGRAAIQLAVIGIVGSVALLTPINVLIARGYTMIYWDSRAYGHAWLLASVAIYFVVIETGIYWIHRAMHWGPLYRHIHKYHHRWRAPTSWVSQAFHPLDSFALSLPLHLLIFVVPVHGALFIAMQTFFSFWAVSCHDRVSLVHWRWFNHTDNHTLHHWFFQCNYGQFTTFWDRLMGTWSDPVEAARTGRVPASIVRRLPEKPRLAASRVSAVDL